MEYKNYDKIIKNDYIKRDFKVNHPLLPKNPFRMCMIGASGTGKSNTLMNMLMDFLDYDCLYIISPSIFDQNIYLHINELSAKFPESIRCYDKIEDFDLQEIDGTKTNLVIFDDCVTEKKLQPIITSAFAYGRHKACSIIYLSQSFFDIPKLIRNNCNQYCLFKLGQSNEIDYIKSRIAGDISVDAFRKMYNHCMKIPYAFLYVDTITDDPRMKYRLRFDKPLEFKI